MSILRRIDSAVGVYWVGTIVKIPSVPATTRVSPDMRTKWRAFYGTKKQ